MPCKISPFYICFYMYVFYIAEIFIRRVKWRSIKATVHSLTHTPAIKVFDHLNCCRKVNNPSVRLVNFQFSECHFTFDKVYCIIFVKLPEHSWVKNMYNACRLEGHKNVFITRIQCNWTTTSDMCAHSSMKLLDNVKNNTN